MISKEVTMETKSMKSVAVPVTNFFGSEEYVKVKKSDWNKILDVSARQYQEIISWKSMRRKFLVWSGR